jgi:hypothetical protein
MLGQLPLPWFCVLLALAACTHGPADDGRGVHFDTTVESGPLLDRIPEVTLAPGEYLFDFESRLDEGDMGDPRIIGWHGHECGATTVVAKLSAMPMDRPDLAPVTVVEFDQGGRRMREWVTPFETGIVGLAGDRLRFRVSQQGVERAFWTDPSGRLGPLVDDGAEEVQRRFPVEACPASLLGDDAPLESWQCYRVKDDQGVDRRIGFPIPCN